MTPSSASEIIPPSTSSSSTAQEVEHGPEVLTALKSEAAALAAAAAAATGQSKPAAGSGTAALLSRTGLTLSRPSALSHDEMSPSDSDGSLGFGSIFSGESAARLERVSVNHLQHQHQQHGEETAASSPPTGKPVTDEAAADDILAARSLSGRATSSSPTHGGPPPYTGAEAVSSGYRAGLLPEESLNRSSRQVFPLPNPFSCVESAAYDHT